MSQNVLDFHSLIHAPAHQLVEVAYQHILERAPSFSEQAYHLARLNRGCSRKLFILSILYSGEAQRRFPQKHFSAGKLVTLFHRIAHGKPRVAKFMIKCLHYADVLTGRAREMAYQFNAEWQLRTQQEAAQQVVLMQQNVQLMQQDVQRRIDLFLMEAMQTLSGNLLTPAEKDAWHQRVSQATQHLNS